MADCQVSTIEILAEVEKLAVPTCDQEISQLRPLSSMKMGARLVVVATGSVESVSVVKDSYQSSPLGQADAKSVVTCKLPTDWAIPKGQALFARVSAGWGWTALTGQIDYVRGLGLHSLVFIDPARSHAQCQ